jgi:serine/threonine protein phosphatase PrpC
MLKIFFFWKVRDPGGRLGAYLNENKPDLRNLKVYCEILEEDDTILLCSDGIHDNFGENSST